MFLQRFFVPETPTGYRPGSLLAQIAQRDVPGMTCRSDRPEAMIDLDGLRIDVRERIKRDFLQHTSLAVYTLGQAEGSATAKAQHTGGFRRTGVRYTGDDALTERLQQPAIVKALMPLDFTRLEVTGTPGACRIELETYGGAEVVLRLPRVRRYVPMGPEQSSMLLDAFRAMASALSIPRPAQPTGGNA